METDILIFCYIREKCNSRGGEFKIVKLSIESYLVESFMNLTSFTPSAYISMAHSIYLSNYLSTYHTHTLRPLRPRSSPTHSPSSQPCSFSTLLDPFRPSKTHQQSPFCSRRDYMHNAGSCSRISATAFMPSLVI